MTTHHVRDTRTGDEARNSPTDDAEVDPGAKAAEYFASGLNCAESTLRACNDANHCGLPASAFGIATPFGGGMSGLRLVCGAVTGGFMAIGLARGRSEPTEPPGPASEAAVEFHTRFQERFGAISCRDLLGDLTPRSPEQKAFCTGCVSFAAQAVTDVLAGVPSASTPPSPETADASDI